MSGQSFVLILGLALGLLASHLVQQGQIARLDRECVRVTQ